MAGKWIKSKYPGVRFRYHPTRKYGVGRDKYLTIYYKLDGKPKQEALGWMSKTWEEVLPDGTTFKEGWTEKKAAALLAELQHNQRTGSGPRTLAEKRELEERRREEESETQKMKEIDEISFTEVWETYLPYSQANKRSAESWKREVTHYKKWIKPVIGDIPMKKITPFLLEKIKKNMNDKKLAPRTIHYALAVIRQVFNYAIRNDLFFGPNPVSKVKKPTSDNRRLRFLSPAEARTILDSLKKEKYKMYSICLLSLHCGLRAGEITNLTWGAVDFDNEQIAVVDTKSGRNRYVFMTGEVKEMLTKKRKEDPQAQASDYLFQSRQGSKMTWIPRDHKKIIEKMGLNHGVTDRRQLVVFHTFRHTFASWHAQNGTSLHVLQQLMGHETFSMVLRYAHLQPDNLKAATKKFDQALNSGQEKVVPMVKNG